jgi:hypothetical protein
MEIRRSGSGPSGNGSDWHGVMSACPRQRENEDFAMKRDQRFSRSFQSAVLVSGTLVGFLGTAITAVAQDLGDLQTPKSPLVLKAQGCFFVGGEKVKQTHVELGSFGPPGHISINQMYVRYMVPQGSDGNVPVVMIHGMTLTGKTWETTPDGRMGWDGYFVRRGHPVYVPDQVSRGRSGFNQAVFNDVRAGATPSGEQPPLRRFSDEVVWPNFRFGPEPGVPYPDEQFPVAAVDELAKQSLPDMNPGLPTPNASAIILVTHRRGSRRCAPGRRPSTVARP